METIIAIFLGLFLTLIGIIGFIRIGKDFEKGDYDK